MINLDAAANYPILDQVTEIMRDPINHFNPHSNHALGFRLERRWNDGLKQILARYPGYTGIELIPGGGTLANRRALVDSLSFHPKKNRKGEWVDIILVSSMEHQSIYETAGAELQLRRYNLVQIPSLTHGIVDTIKLVQLFKTYQDRVAAVSIHWVNNEIGTIQPIRTIRRLIPEGCIFHSDASHGWHLASTLKDGPDIVTFSGYKIGGPHVGLILHNSRVRLKKSYYGTPDLGMLLGLVESINWYFANYSTITKTYYRLNRHLRGLITRISDGTGIGIRFLTELDHSKPSILSILLPPGIEGKTVQRMMGEQGVLVSSGSACSAQKKSGSHVLTSMGYTTRDSFGSLRFSFSHQTGKKELETSVNVLKEILVRLKADVVTYDAVPPKISEPTKRMEMETLGEIDYTASLTSTVVQRVPDLYLMSIGELWLKKCNRARFQQQLFDNLCGTYQKLKTRLGIETNMKVIRKRAYMGVPFDPRLSPWLSKIPGFSRIQLCYQIEYKETISALFDTLTMLVDKLVKMVSDGSPVQFKVRCRVNGDGFGHSFASNRWNIILGQFINDRFGTRVAVNLNHPDILIDVLFQHTTAYVSAGSLPAQQGLPVGVEGTVYLEVDAITDQMDRITRQISSRGLNVNWVSDTVTQAEYDKEYDWFNSRGKVVPHDGPPEMAVYFRQLEAETSPKDQLDEDARLEASGERVVVTPDIWNITGVRDMEDVPVLNLLSGGLDSPVASWMMNSRGMKVDYVHFTTDIGKAETVRQIVNRLKTLYPDGSHRLWMVEFGSVQKQVLNKCRAAYRTLMYKVLMLRIGAMIARKNGHLYLATGNSIGQVASQTLSNLLNTRNSSEMYIISPLLIYNKEQIIDLSRRHGFYEMCTAPGTEDCCTMYLPKHPVTKSSLVYINDQVKKLGDYLSLVRIEEVSDSD